MISYCKSTTCLRAYLLRYFGAGDVKDTCDNCENCLHPKTKITADDARDNDAYEDLTIDTQKVLSCVWRMKERYGLNMVAQVLKGSSDSRLLECNLDKLTTYGLFHTKTLRDIKDLINRIIDLGHIFYDDQSEFPILRISASGVRVLKGEEKVFALREVKKKRRRQERYDQGQNPDPDLFEKLRQVRLDFAKKQAVPPYAIFSDATLRSMCEVLPTTLAAMLNVSGVGEHKLKKYGQAFLDVIRAHLGL